MGSNRTIPDVSCAGHPLMSMDAAGQLLAGRAEVPLRRMEHLSNMNDVFRVTDRRGHLFFVKLHTSEWYREAEDTATVVRREHLAYNMLRRHGVRLQYESWTDFSRSIITRSALITTELPGRPLPTLLRARRHVLPIVAALGRYLAQVHSIRLPVAGYLEFSGDPAVVDRDFPDRGSWWDSHPCQKASNLISYANTAFSQAKGIPDSVLVALRDAFLANTPALEAEYKRTTFVLNNLHPFHFHLSRVRKEWKVTGVYDFEVTSSGNPSIDMELMDLQLTPQLQSLGWRKTFLESYGLPVLLETYKVMLLVHLLAELPRAPSALIPQPEWTLARLPELANASSMDELDWYPSKTSRVN